MIRKKSEILRFEILKLLKECPTHGYSLFLILKDQELVDQASDLYKILRFMKDKGYIEGETKKTPKGPNKVILTLTDKGKEQYYKRVIESAKVFHELIMDTSVKRIGAIFINFFEKIGYNSKKFQNKKILFDMPMNFQYNFQSRLINSIFTPLDTEVVVYVQPKKLEERNPFRIFERTKVDLKIIDENLSIKSNSMDIILIFGGFIKEKLDSRLIKSRELLKKDGVIFLIYKSKEKVVTPRVFGGIMESIVQDFPKKHLNDLKEILPPMFYDKPPTKPLNDEQIRKAILEFFEEVQLFKEHMFLDVFIIQKPKLS